MSIGHRAKAHFRPGQAFRGPLHSDVPWWFMIRQCLHRKHSLTSSRYGSKLGDSRQNSLEHRSGNRYLLHLEGHIPSMAIDLRGDKVTYLPGINPASYVARE